MSRASRGPGRPGYDLESVLTVAVEVFTERGYDRTSMEDLSGRLGISKSAIYYHVAGKEALLGLALDRAIGGLSAAAHKARELDAPAIERLESLVHDSVIVLVDQLPYVTLLLRLRGNTGVERRALARRREIDSLTAELVEEAIADGDIRADIDADVAARLLFGQINSLVEWYKPRRNDNGAAIAGTVVSVAFRGLCAGGRE